MFSLFRNIVFSPYRCNKHIRVYINLEITLKRLYRFVPFVAYSHFRYVRQTRDDSRIVRCCLVSRLVSA